MVLVVGGSHQGKRAYACKRFGLPKENFIDGASCTLEELYHCVGVYHFHEFMKKSMSNKKNLLDIHTLLREKNPEIIIITNEIGYGIVPIDPFERRYREQTGRICCKLAEASSQVYRVVSGIGMMIKDTTTERDNHLS